MIINGTRVGRTKSPSLINDFSHIGQSFSRIAYLRIVVRILYVVGVLSFTYYDLHIFCRWCIVVHISFVICAISVIHVLFIIGVFYVVCALSFAYHSSHIFCHSPIVSRTLSFAQCPLRIACVSRVFYHLHICDFTNQFSVGDNDNVTI